MFSATAQQTLASDQIITEVNWPLAWSGYNMDQWIDAALFIGELTGGKWGIPYEGPNQLIRLDVQPGGFYPDVPSREVLPVFGGTVGVIIAPVSSAVPGEPFSGGVWWERASIAQGWLEQDWPGVNGEYPIEEMPPGPMAGYEFQPPDWILAAVLYELDFFATTLGPRGR